MLPQEPQAAPVLAALEQTPRLKLHITGLAATQGHQLLGIELSRVHHVHAQCTVYKGPKASQCPLVSSTAGSCSSAAMSPAGGGASTTTASCYKCL